MQVLVGLSAHNMRSSRDFELIKPATLNHELVARCPSTCSSSIMLKTHAPRPCVWPALHRAKPINCSTCQRWAAMLAQALSNTPPVLPSHRLLNLPVPLERHEINLSNNQDFCRNLITVLTAQKRIKKDEGPLRTKSKSRASS